jgi:viologen exporter family transport system permease protein
MRAALSTYGAFVRLGWVQALHDRAELGGRVAFVAIILGVFSALWRAAAEAGMPMGLARPSLVWYLAATEWILLSGPAVHLEIEGDVRRGDVTYQLLRPYSYLLALWAKGVGMLAARAPLVGGAAFICAAAVTRQVPDVRVFAEVVPLGLLAMTQIYALYVIVGLTAFWLDDVSPLFWIVQKLLFVLGGLMLPLFLFPAWMQHAGAWTPFPSLLGRPAGLMLADGGRAWDVAAPLALWTVAIAAIALALFRLATRMLHTQGG